MTECGSRGGGGDCSPFPRRSSDVGFGGLTVWTTIQACCMEADLSFSAKEQGGGQRLREQRRARPIESGYKVFF